MRLIDANALKKALKSNCTPELCHDYNTNWCESCCRTNDFEDLIDNAPTVAVTDYDTGYQDGLEAGLNDIRTKGEWIKEPNGKTTDIYRCSVCKRSIMLCKGADLTNYPFCHCGADMRKVATEND